MAIRRFHVLLGLFVFGCGQQQSDSDSVEEWVAKFDSTRQTSDEQYEQEVDSICSLARKDVERFVASLIDSLGKIVPQVNEQPNVLSEPHTRMYNISQALVGVGRRCGNRSMKSQIESALRDAESRATADFDFDTYIKLLSLPH